MNLKPFHTLVKLALPAEKVFMFEMPDLYDRAILIKTGAGGAVEDLNYPGYKRARLQAIVREKEFQNGYALAKQVATALKKSRLTSESVYILTVNPLHDPIPFRRSEGGYLEFSVNFQAVYIEA